MLNYTWHSKSAYVRPTIKRSCTNLVDLNLVHSFEESHDEPVFQRVDYGVVTGTYQLCVTDPEWVYPIFSVSSDANIRSALTSPRRRGTYKLPDPPLAKFQPCPRIAILEFDEPSNLDDGRSFQHPLPDSGSQDTVARCVDALKFAYARVSCLDPVVRDSGQLRAGRARINNDDSIFRLAVG